MGAEIFWDLSFFYFENYIFFSMETFRLGVGCPCRGGRPLKKTAGGGWGEALHSQNMLGNLPPVRRIFWVLCSQFVVGSQKNILCP